MTKKERLAQISERLDLGLSRQQIADEIGVKVSSVNHYVSDLGRAGVSHTLDPELSARIVELYDTGIDRLKIAEKIGISHARVVGYLRRAGHTGRNTNYVKELTEHQRNVLLGTLLGDGSLIRNEGARFPHFSCGHGPKQADYLRWKVEQLQPFFVSPVRESVSNFGTPVFKATSRNHPLFVEFYALLYSRDPGEITRSIHKKQVTKETLARVNEEALAIWWCDDGSTSHRNSAKQQTLLQMVLGAMTDSEYKLIQDWFCSKGYPSYLIHPTAVNCVCLRFNLETSKKLLRTMLPFIPECMHHKLGNAISQLDTPLSRASKKSIKTHHETLKTMWIDGRSKAEICEATGLGRHAVAITLTRLGLVKAKKYDPELHRKIIAARANGWSQERVGYEVGVQQTTVSSYLRKPPPSLQ